MADKPEIAKNLTLEEFARFRDYIHTHSGIFLEDGKLDSLRISLIARATRREVPTLDAYLDILISDDAEFRELLNVITINETSFFRFPAQFAALRDHVLPEILENKVAGSRNLRVWSAGCSTGEEPYSIAMSLVDSGVEALGWKPHVIGTDVSTKALTVARNAVYPRKATGNLSEGVLRDHFVAEGDRCKVALHARKLVDFQYHNLIKEPYPLEMITDWDIIFCRNVTIYFKLESTRRVVANFFEGLSEGGYLFVGHSETLTTVSDDFEPVEVGGVFLYRKPRGKRRGFLSMAPTPVAADQHAREPRTARARRTASRAPAAQATSRPAAASSTRGGELDPIGELIAEARGLFTERRPADVLVLVDRILEMEPNSAEAHVFAAHAYADMDDFDAALSACQRALAINTLLPEARYILGLIYQREGDVVQAISEFKRTIYIDPDFALAHMNLGTIYKSQQQWEMAARSYENAVHAQYKDPDGAWRQFLGGFQADLLVKTCERSLLECRKAMGIP
jgi:chemotaxis protein methyltransferase CheR